MKELLIKLFKSNMTKLIIAIVLTIIVTFSFAWFVFLSRMEVDANNKMDINSPEFAQFMDSIIQQKINQSLKTLDKRLTGTVTAIGSGTITFRQDGDITGVTITASNPNEIPCEIGDEISVIAVNGSNNSLIVEYRKGIMLNNIYVDYDTGLDDYQHGTIDKPFKTLQYAVNRLPKNLNKRIIHIYYGALNSSEALEMNGFYGGGLLIITPVSGTSITYIDSLLVEGCAGMRININYLGFTTTSNECVSIGSSSYITLYNIAINAPSGLYAGVYVYNDSVVVVANSIIENRTNGIMADGCCNILSQNNTGNNSNFGLWAQWNSEIGKSGTQCTGTVGNENALSGSIIR